MPITLNIVDHAANLWPSPKAATAETLLQEASPKNFRRTRRVVQSSFTKNLEEDHISPSDNGFVWAAIQAYSSHHHLTIRPEDVWFAILNQLGFYINANAESLRSFFVGHQGQKKLTVIETGTTDTVDFGAIAEKMTQLIAKNVKDPELRDWVMPAFTTTTVCDIAVASVLFMGAMQKYFKYELLMDCGIPSVTVLGEISDWEAILTKLDKLEQLGEEPTHFANILRPILRNIILSFTEPTSSAVIKFWNSIADMDQMSGSTEYNGWIAAFCYWSEEGEARKYMHSGGLNGNGHLSIDGSDIPPGYCSVPVQVNDNGTEYTCTMIAGSVGIQACADCASAAEEGHLTAIQPLSGWWICENESDDTAKAREIEIQGIREELKPLEESFDKEMKAYFESHDPGVPYPKNARLHELQVRLEDLEAF